MRKLGDKRVILDGVHQLPNHQEILRIAAQESSLAKLFVTCSLSLHAYSSLLEIGSRIAQVWLTPIMSQDLVDFGQTSLDYRFLRGGLPPFFMKGGKTEKDFQEWVNMFWAKEIQEPFRLERRNSFKMLMEILFAKSGELFEANRLVDACGMSHPTIMKYLLTLQACRAIQIIRPFSTKHGIEITSTPKTYAFDTGFYCSFRGWQELRQEDFGILWKHWVLNELNSRLQNRKILYWRDKRGHEIDFIIVTKEMGITAIICQWKARDFEVRNLRAFRRRYPEGRNWIVCGDKVQANTQIFGKVRAEFISLKEMNDRIDPLRQF
ncbi:MAG: DUF4143 domain-containing protein [Syntrophaceae bacterium]|nr:DUF4143 domain-containing protein [Syntrophaceae bacterium]